MKIEIKITDEGTSLDNLVMVPLPEQSVEAAGVLPEFTKKSIALPVAAAELCRVRIQCR